MYRDIQEALKAYPRYQLASDTKKIDPHLSSQPNDVLTTWVLDVQYMPDDNGYKGIIEARCALSGYLEA